MDKTKMLYSIFVLYLTEVVKKVFVKVKKDSKSRKLRVIELLSSCYYLKNLLHI